MNWVLTQSSYFSQTSFAYIFVSRPKKNCLKWCCFTLIVACYFVFAGGAFLCECSIRLWMVPHHLLAPNDCSSRMRRYFNLSARWRWTWGTEPGTWGDMKTTEISKQQNGDLSKHPTGLDRLWSELIDGGKIGVRWRFYQPKTDETIFIQPEFCFSMPNPQKNLS